MITIDDNIPVPERRHGRSSNYPFRVMEVGQSFAVPALDERTLDSVRSAAGYERKVSGRTKNFRVLAVTEDGTPMIRAWRVE